MAKVWVVVDEAGALKRWLQKNGKPTHNRALAHEWASRPPVLSMLADYGWEAKEVEPYAS